MDLPPTRALAGTIQFVEEKTATHAASGAGAGRLRRGTLRLLFWRNRLLPVTHTRLSARAPTTAREGACAPRLNCIVPADSDRLLSKAEISREAISRGRHLAVATRYARDSTRVWAAG